MKKLSVFTVFFLLCLSIYAQPSETFTIPPRWVHWISDPDFVAEGGDLRNGFSVFGIMGGDFRTKDGNCYPHYAYRNRYNDYNGAAIQKIRISDGKLEWTNLYNHRNLPEHQLALDIVNINSSGNIELIGVKRMANQYPAQPTRPWILGDLSVPFLMELDDSNGSILNQTFDPDPPSNQIGGPFLSNFYKSSYSNEGSMVFTGRLRTSEKVVVGYVPVNEKFNHFQNFNDDLIFFDTITSLDEGYFDYMRSLVRINQYSLGFFQLSIDPKDLRAAGFFAKYDYLEDENRLEKVYQKDILSKIPTNVSLNTGATIYDVGNDRTMLFSLKIAPGNSDPHGWGIIFDPEGNEIAEINDFFAEGTEHGYWFINTLYSNEERIYFSGWPSVTGKEGIDFFSVNLADGRIKNYGSMVHEGPYIANKTIGAVMTEEGDIAVRILLYRNQTDDWYLGMAGYRAEDFGIDDLRVGTQDVETVRPQAYELSPNPAQTEVLIRRVGAIADGNVELSITDLSGRMLRSQKLSCEGSCTLDVSELSAGMYILQIQSPTGQIAETHKLSIIR